MKQQAILVLTAAVAVTGLALSLGAEETPTTNAPTASVASPKEAVTHDVDLAICLDTSGSMDGLIESAKQKLWTIVNELATAKPRPRLRVALYQYGNDGLTSENGWVQRLCPLTDNLDEVYDQLFKLQTNGGTEFVARVVRAATSELEWSKQTHALKMIVVAGNEPATQDTKYPLEATCRETIGRGIIVNTIFCGPEADGRNTGWADAARWADGQYAAIDQNTGTVVVSTPHDKELLALNEELNKTYLAYGSGGAKGVSLQITQDANAAIAGAPAAAQRVAAKSTALYRNASWDLVDAVKDGKLRLTDVKAEELPVEMQNMSSEEREAHVKKMAQTRANLQEKIHKVDAMRQAYQKEEMAKKGLDESKSFDANLRQAIRQQGAKNGLTFETK